MNVLRGCQRKIILLKGTDSQIFDEAYFLLRRGAENRDGEEIVREAQRIVDHNTTRHRRRVRTREVWIFFAGAALGATLAVIVVLLL